MRQSPEESRDSVGEGAAGALTVMTYIPSDAPVRAKTLFASTRATLIKELGRERFEGRNFFVTDRREILDLREWEERNGDVGKDVDERVLTREEREERVVRRAEEEERYGGTKGRDLMGNGGGSGEGEKTLGLKMKMDDPARNALAQMGEGIRNEAGGGVVVQLVSLPTICF